MAWARSITSSDSYRLSRMSCRSSSARVGTSRPPSGYTKISWFLRDCGSSLVLALFLATAFYYTAILTQSSCYNWRAAGSVFCITVLEFNFFIARHRRVVTSVYVFIIIFPPYFSSMWSVESSFNLSNFRALVHGLCQIFSPSPLVPCVQFSGSNENTARLRDFCIQRQQQPRGGRLALRWILVRWSRGTGILTLQTALKVFILCCDIITSSWMCGWCKHVILRTGRGNRSSIRV